MDEEKTKPAPGRRSERAKKRKESYSPELKSERKVLKTNTKPPSRTNPNRLYDLMPNGEPFCCHMCKSPYVACPVNKPGKKKERSRHAPLPNTRVDHATGREMTLCNACAQMYDHPRVRVKKPVSLPTEEEQKAYLADATQLTKSLKQHYDDSRVEKLFCPVSKKKLCGCLQKYIKSKDAVGEESPVPQLLSLMKEAEALRREKVYTVNDTNTKPKKLIGLGNGHKKSKRYESFVLLKRQLLKETMQLCERAIQRILIYSNNFLHKRLKTENRPCRIERTRGKAVLGKLPDLMSLVDLVCCYKNCVAMVWTHRKLLQEWRDRAQQGQMEARRVLAEMLTPTGASNCNCYQFISMVTGCSLTTIGRVFNQMLDTNGDREPPEHGMKRVWQENYKKNKVSTVDTNNMTQAHPNPHQATGTLRQEVTSEQVPANQIAPAPSHYTMEQQKLALIQQELNQKQQQLQQQQEFSLQLLAQHVSSSGSNNLQNTALVQQLFKQLTSQSNNSGSTADPIIVPQSIPSKSSHPQLQYTCATKSTQPVRNSPGFQLSQPKQAHIENPPTSIWNKQVLNTAHFTGIQSSVQQPLPVRSTQLLQSGFPTALNPSLTLNNIQLAVSGNQSQMPPAIITQVPGDQLNTVIPQPGQIIPVSSNQIDSHKQQLNIQNIIIDQSQSVQQHRDPINIDQTHNTAYFHIERQPSDNQSMQIQLVPNPTPVENQSAVQVNMSDSSHVKVSEMSCNPIMINSDLVQQMLHNGTLQIVPMVEQNAVLLNETNKSNQSETADIAQQHQISIQHTHPAVGQRQILPLNVVSHTQPVLSPDDTSVPPSSQDQTKGMGPGQLQQVVQMVKLPAGSIAENESPGVQDSVGVVPQYGELSHNNTVTVVQQEQTYPDPAVTCSGADPTITSEDSGPSMKVAGDTYVTVQQYMPEDPDSQHRSVLGNCVPSGSILPEGTQLSNTDNQASGHTPPPSQIQISFETVIDQTGQTATSHIMLPHSNVLTLPMVPLYTLPTSQVEATQSDCTTLNIEAKQCTEVASDLQQGIVSDQLNVNKGMNTTKTKLTKKKTKKLTEKDTQVGKTFRKEQGYSEGNFSSTGSKRRVKKGKIPEIDLNKNVKKINVSEIVDGHYPRHEDESSTDKSRHSSGNSIRSRQSSGNSECLKQSLLLDSLRPLSGMSDILERSRQYSGNSQFTIRSRTSSGNSYFTEQLHGSLLANLSPNAFLNKEKGVFFLSSENELGEISSIHIPDSVNQMPEFILSDEHVTDLQAHAEIEVLPENQTQTHSEIGSLYYPSKNTDISGNAVNQSERVKHDSRLVLSHGNPLQQQQHISGSEGFSDSVEQTISQKSSTIHIKTLVDKSPVLNSLLLKPPKHKPWSHSKDSEKT